MGLDNGILARSQTTIPALRKYVYEIYPLDEQGYVVYELCYWRKCWNIRSIILHSVLRSRNTDQYEFPLSADHIKDIIDYLSGLNNKNWHDSGGSIWEFSEQRGHIKRHIKALRTLLKVMRKHEIDVWFYDSY